MSSKQSCIRCYGSGRVSCSSCGGSGKVTQNQMVRESRWVGPTPMNPSGYKDEWVSKSVQVNCTSCGGSGKVHCPGPH